MAYDNEADVNGRRSGQTRVEIRLNDVNDNNPTFEPKPVATPIAENIDNGTIVTTVSARDADEGMNSQIEYYIADGGNLTGRFNVDNGTGEVAVVASLISFTGTRVLTVGARDKGEPPLNGTLQIVFSVKDVNLHPPNFTRPGGNYNTSNPFILEVDEEQPLHSEMFILEADDEDNGVNGQVAYRIEPSRGDDWTFFFIDTTFGNLSNTKILDRETRPTFTIDVSAQDQGTPVLKTTLSLMVRLLDIDDNDPYFPSRKQDISIAEEETGCYGNLSLADDKDEGENNTRRCYYIHSGDQPHATYFSLNKTTGTLCLNQKLDREEKDLINLIIKVSKDCSLNESPQNPFHPPFNQSDTSLLHVEVHVEDINDNPPVFADGGELSTGILYDVNKGEFVYDLKIHVTDKDIGSNAITYFRDRGQNVHGISDLETTKPFKVDNGSVITDTLFSSSMLGHVEIAIEAYDDGDKHTADATLKVYIISNVQRVKIIFHSLPDEVQNIKSAFISELEQLLKYRVVVDKIATHENPDKTTDDTKTDMFVHALYNATGEVVPATELWRAFDFTVGVAELFQRYKVTESQPVVDQLEADDTLTRTLTMTLILVAVILTLIAISLAVSLYCIRGKYIRRLRAETTAVSVNHIEKEAPPPGTNLYTASNPVFMKEGLTKPQYEPESDDDSLDNNEVDNDGPANIETVDEQEVTMRIDEYDAMRTMIRNPALDDVLRHHADMEKTRAKEDKQSLIDDDGSDADSGTYTSIQGLQQSDI